MSKRANDVTLFSNGIGHFRRVYSVPTGRPEAISIPFKRDNIGDVAASLQVFGAVKLNTPPSFTPMNANATALQIDQSNALRSLFQSLSGASVTVHLTGQHGPSKFTLLGTEADTMESASGATVERDFVVLMNGGSVLRKPFSEIEHIHFDEESVRTEIDKALKNNFQRIKPDSTLLDLSLTAVGEADTDAIVQYTIPVAAWKMRYAIREDKGKFSLEGAAIIDNNTDEDWDNFRVSVVTGNPISFNTDIANVVVPNRKFVKLVENGSLGNVEVESGYGVAACGGSSPTRAASEVYAARMSMKSSVSNYASFGLESASAAPDEMADLELAESAGVDSKEVGDFCVFTSKEPITILARKSAVVPMFSVPLSRAGIVLLYKESSNATRPYRTVKFKNETEYSLGKGKTVIYNEGIFSGECVLEATKPGENRMLPHCLENGVKFDKEDKGVETRRSSMRFSEGVAVYEDVSTAVTTYRIENKKDEPFKLAMEHTNVLGRSDNVMVDFDGVELSEKERLTNSNGHRLYFELAPKQVATITATETAVSRHTVTLGNHFNWVKLNIIDMRNPLAEDGQVRAAVAVQREIDAVSISIEENKARRQELTQQAARTRENLGAAKDVANSSTVADWVRDLDVTEKEIRRIDKDVLPGLVKQQRELQDKMTTALRAITVSWKA